MLPAFALWLEPFLNAPLNGRTNKVRFLTVMCLFHRQNFNSHWNRQTVDLMLIVRTENSNFHLGCNMKMLD